MLAASLCMRILNSVVPEQLIPANDCMEFILNIKPDSDISTSYSKLIDFSENHMIDTKYIQHLLDIGSHIRRRNIELYADLFIKVENYSKTNYFPDNQNFRIVLNSKGMELWVDDYKTKAEDIISIYPIDTGFYYVAWDKIDEFKRISSAEGFDFNMAFNDVSLIDIAAQYGSSRCFAYLMQKSATLSDKTAKFSVQGGDMGIIGSLPEKLVTFSPDLMRIAMIYNNHDAFYWIMRNYRFGTDLSVPEAFFYGNVRIGSLLLEFGYDINAIATIEVVHHILFSIYQKEHMVTLALKISKYLR